MKRAGKRFVLVLLGVTIGVALTGCVGSIKMPINEYSHVSLEATPFETEFMLSYHLYETLPSAAFTDDWTGKIKFDLLGTVYDSEVSGSPAAKKIERGWESFWIDEQLSWTSVERFIHDETLIDYDSTGEAPRSLSANPDAYNNKTNLPIAELPFFIFASPTNW